MPYLLLVLSVVVGLVLIARGVSGADPKSVKRVLKWTAIVLGVVLVVYFGFTGRLAVIGWIAAALLPLILRGRALGRMARSWRGPTPGQTSDIETAYLRMRLDHDSGELKGTVLQGRFQGRLLEELSLAELVELLQECRVHDEQAATVLETYLDRAHGAAWRGGEDARAGGGGRAGAAAGGGRAGAAGGGLSRDEAYEILGLKRGASPDDIREAHRRLMQKNHPDHGGSTYIAAKINQAKDLLLG